MPIGDRNHFDMGLFDCRIALLRVPYIIINTVNYRHRKNSTSGSNHTATPLVRSHLIASIDRYQRFP